MQRLSDTNMYFHSASSKRSSCNPETGDLDATNWPKQLLLSDVNTGGDKDNNLNWSYLVICSLLPFSAHMTHCNCTNSAAAHEADNQPGCSRLRSTSPRGSVTAQVPGQLSHCSQPLHHIQAGLCTPHTSLG